MSESRDVWLLLLANLVIAIGSCSLRDALASQAPSEDARRQQFEQALQEAMKRDGSAVWCVTEHKKGDTTICVTENQLKRMKEK